MTHRLQMEALATLDGWTRFKYYKGHLYGTNEDLSLYNQKVPDYLNSHDALKSIEGKLTRETMDRAIQLLFRLSKADMDGLTILEIIKKIMAVSPEVLAEAMLKASDVWHSEIPEATWYKP